MDLRPFIYGGVASMFAELCTFPIDTTKTRLQIQGELQNNSIKHFKGGKYNGMFHALKVIVKQEGFSALYRGLNAAIIRQASYGTMKMGLYQTLKARRSRKAQVETFSNNILYAVIAGATASSIANPTDVIKIRLQAKSNYNKNNTGFLRELSVTASKEGLPGLYKAVIPNAARAAVLVGVLLPTYDLVKHGLISENIFHDNAFCHLTSTLIAATVAAFFTCPVEVIRTRLMNQTLVTTAGYQQPVFYKNFFVCLRQTVKNERAVALWKGFVPTWLRIWPWNAIYFLCFEKILKLDHNLFN